MRFLAPCRLLVCLAAGCSGSSATLAALDPADAGDPADVDAAAWSDDTTRSEPMLVLPAEFLAENSPLKMLVDGDDVELRTPPQGGHILTISAKVKNFPGRAAQLRATVRDAKTNVILAEESRTVAMLDVPGEPGFKQPNLSSTSQASQVPVCPDYGQSDVVDREYALEVQVTTLEVTTPLVAQASRLVVPRCSPEDVVGIATCRCECSANYELGKCGLLVDGGTDAPDAS
jgi:hypothetical protein